MTTVAEAHVSLELPLHHSLVGNREVQGSAGRRAAVSPATGEAFASCSLLTADQASEAIGAARAALPAWRALPFRDRARLLLALRTAVVTQADGITYTIVNGQVLYEGRRHTGALPGQVLRAGQPAA